MWKFGMAAFGIHEGTHGCRSVTRFVFVLFVLCTGCQRADERNSPTAKRLQILARVYGDYAAASGKAPLNAEQLAAHVKNLESFVAEAFAPGDEILGNYTSERDGQPFVIRYGIPSLDYSPGSRIPIAYERVGVNGRRLVTNLNGVVEHLDEQSLKERGVSDETPAAVR